MNGEGKLMAHFGERLRKVWACAPEKQSTMDVGSRPFSSYPHRTQA